MNRTLDMLSDAALCQRAATELPYVTTAFETLVRRHQSNLSSFCRRMLRDPDRAEDATQETEREDYVRNQESTACTAAANGCAPDVDELLASLSMDDREILSLRFVAGLTLQEIADSYELTLSAAKMRLYRAIEQLRATLIDTDPNFFADLSKAQTGEHQT